MSLSLTGRVSIDRNSRRRYNAVNRAARERAREPKPHRVSADLLPKRLRTKRTIATTTSSPRRLRRLHNPKNLPQQRRRKQHRSYSLLGKQHRHRRLPLPEVRSGKLMNCLLGKRSSTPSFRSRNQPRSRQTLLRSGQRKTMTTLTDPLSFLRRNLPAIRPNSLPNVQQKEPRTASTMNLPLVMRRNSVNLHRRREPCASLPR